jgi:hypothetical protein
MKEQAEIFVMEVLDMIQLEQHDLRPLEGFVYLWRWTDRNHNVLPASDLAQIHPLIKEKREELWQHAYVYLQDLFRYAFDDTSEPITTSSLFEWIQHIDISHKEIDVVQQHLMTFEPQGDQIVIVMWGPEEAVAVPWHIFCTYWDDFCYPSADDVVGVLPISETWYLLYHHEDQLLFGRPRLPLLDITARKPGVVQAKPLILRDEVLRLLQTNEKIAAVNLYRQETGVGLKEAIAAVNKLIAELQQGSDQS